MNRMRRMMCGLAAALACALAAGCSNPTESYWGKRWLDFADCFDASTGVAWPVPYVRLKVTDWFVVGAGHGETIFAIGWHGRYTAAGTELERGEGVPFTRNLEWPGAPPMITTVGVGMTTREYDPDVKPCEGTQRAEKYQIGIWIVFGLNLRLSFNPVEFADLIGGFFGADMLKDDTVEPPSWPAKMRRPEAPVHPVL